MINIPNEMSINIPLSVVITTYNRPELLCRCLESIYKQNYTNIEVIIIDDHSVPCYKEEILNKYPHINYIYQKENKGPGLSRNHGIEAANNDFVIIMDDDDVFLPDSFKKIAEFISSLNNNYEYPVYNFLCSNASVKYKEYYHVYSFKDLISGAISGDLVHLFNKKYPLHDKGYFYPTAAIGAEALLWNRIAVDEGIPIINELIVKVLTDAGDRLTNFENQINKSNDFADYQLSVIKQFKEDIIKTGNTSYLNSKYIGAVIYSLLSGKRNQAFHTWKELMKYSSKHLWIIPLFLIPKAMLANFFIKYRRRKKKL